MEVEARENQIITWVKTHRVQTIAIISAFVLILAGLIALVIIWCQPASDEKANTTYVVDYKQKVTDINGERFNANYSLSSGETFGIRFANLNCDTSACENVTAVEFDGRALRRGVDYDLKKGSIIIILMPGTFRDVEAGDHDLILTVETTNRTLHVGVKIHVSDDDNSCSDGQILENGVCVTPEAAEESPVSAPESPAPSAPAGSNNSRPSDPNPPATTEQPNTNESNDGTATTPPEDQTQPGDEDESTTPSTPDTNPDTEETDPPASGGEDEESDITE